jgi:hypothetical protein
LSGFQSKVCLAPTAALAISDLGNSALKRPLWAYCSA